MKTPYSNATCSMVLLLGLLSACAHSAGEIATETVTAGVPAVIHSGVDTMDEEQTRARIVAIMGSPEVQQAAQLLTERLTDGTLDALSDEERARRIADVADKFVVSLSKSVGEGMRDSIGPQIVNMVSRSVDQSLQRAFSEGNQQRIAQTVATVMQQSVATMAASMNEQLRPALQAMLREDLGPALRDGLNDEATQRALASTLRTFTHQAVLGMQDAFAEIDAREQAGRGHPTILSRIQRLTVDGSSFIRYAVIGLVLAVVALAAWLLHARARIVLATKEADRREAALLALVEAIKSTENQPWGADLRTALKESFRDNEKAEYLRELLRNNKHARLSHQPPPRVVPLRPA